jgi:NitT/TauT family transport system permease protein
MKKRLVFALNSVLVFVALLLVWQGSIKVFQIEPYILPPPLLVAQVLAGRMPEILDALQLSAEAAVGGLLASTVAGVLVALMFARSRWIRSLLFPYTILLQTVPIIALVPLIVVWVGQGMMAVIVVTFIICLPPIIANTTQGLVSVDEDLVRLFVMHNATPMQVLWRLRLPNALPHFFVGLRIASGIAVIGAFTGELFAGSGSVGKGGLGYTILYAMQQVQIGYLFALVIALTCLGFAMFFTVMFFEWLALHKWHESASAGRVE